VWIFLDIVFTTYSMEGGGKLTDAFFALIWSIFFRLAGHSGKKKLLKYAGMYMMFLLILLWGIGLWLGVFLIFASDPDSILDSSTNLPATLAEKFYY